MTFLVLSAILANAFFLSEFARDWSTAAALVWFLSSSIFFTWLLTAGARWEMSTKINWRRDHKTGWHMAGCWRAVSPIVKAIFAGGLFFALF